MKQQLNANEYDVMCVLQQAEKPLTAAEIVKTNSKWTVNIVNPCLRKLLVMKLVEVADIVYNKNKLSRAFRVTKEAPMIMQELFSDELTQFRKIVSEQCLMSSFVQSSVKTEQLQQNIEAMKKLIEEYENKQ